MDAKLQDLSELMAQMRPRLHRYCARMVGSAFDGEDVVQDAFAKAAEALQSMGPIERPESWLFHIAHNTALDALRRRKRYAALRSQFGQLGATGAGNAESRVAASASLSTLLRLPVAQRASVVLIDVLGHSAEEVSDILAVSVPAAKAALHRGRARLKLLAQNPMAETPRFLPEERDRLRAYADRFNARDFDGLRALLAEDVRLDLVNRVRLAGAKDVSVYFTRYSQSADWRFSVGQAEGRPVLLVSEPGDDSVRYVVLLVWKGDRIAAIRDFRYTSYVTESLAIVRAETPAS